MGSVYWSLSFNKGSNEKTYYTLCIARTKNEWGKNQPLLVTKTLRFIPAAPPYEVYLLVDIPGLAFPINTS